MVSKLDKPLCECCKCCTPHRVKLIFFILSFVLAILSFIMIAYGGATTFIVYRGDTQGTIDFSTILAPFIKCSQASNPYYYSSYSSAVNNAINDQACAVQAPAVYFFILTACLVIVLQAFALYAYAKETMGGLYLSAMQLAVTAAMLLIGIYVMAATTNSTAIQCIPCDGNFSVNEQQTINSAGFPGLVGRCMNGIAGTNTGAKSFITSIAVFYVGTAFGLINMVLWQYLLAYIFAHRLDDENDLGGSNTVELGSQRDLLSSSQA